jgi:asparagine synthase (glutamine-hydrolysing)
MCGIAGIISEVKFDPSLIQRMTGALSHRGPDAKGTYTNELQTISLGHTRLSIIDLSTMANQPFYSNNRRYVIVFNGEIYNFKELRKKLELENGVVFKTTSDTEIIIEAYSVWGNQMTQQLEGMFALAIIDQSRNTIFLCRDRVGKKPLYYFKSRGLFAFASEIKSLLKLPIIQNEKKVNQKAISTFLHLGFIPEPDTIFENIHKFPSGHFGEVDNNLNLEIHPYWDIKDAIYKPAITNEQEAKNQLSTLLENSVAKRLISDVPLGSFLSGGTDSSLISAIAAKQLSSPLKTFSIGFKENKFNESTYAREVAKHLKTDHTEYVLEQKEAIGLVETYLHHFDEPFADTSAIPTMLVSKLSREKVKVALTGDGGDELFQGYGSYAWANRLEKGSWKLFRTPLRHAMNLSGNSRLQRIAHLLKTYTGSERSHIFSQEQYLFSQNEIQNKLLIDKNIFVPFIYDESYLQHSRLSPGEKQAIFDLKYYLKDDLLVKVDRASMYYALECRSPLLDYEVIEYALSLDVSLKIREGKTKWILKELLRKHLPDNLIDRQKWGFSVPLGSWLKNDLRYLMDDYLNEDVITSANLVNFRYVQKLKSEFLGGSDYLYNRLWVIIVLHKWWKENV